jgi:AcrR family transcriptional regulator
MPRVIDVETLFEATVTVFADRGYAAATTQEIADRAGVNEVTLFRRYGTKARLVEAALTHCLATSPFAHLVATDDVHTDLVAIVEAYDATNRAYGGAVMTLLTEVPRHPELAGTLSALMTNMARAAAIIEQHQAQGRISAGTALQKAAFLVAPLVAGGLWARALPGMEAARFDQVAVVDAFLKGHAGPTNVD